MSRHRDELVYWDLNATKADLNRFVERLIRLRFQFELPSVDGRLTLEQYETEAHYEWHGIVLDRPDWNDDSHVIAFSSHTALPKRLRYVAINIF